MLHPFWVKRDGHRAGKSSSLAAPVRFVQSSPVAGNTQRQCGRRVPAKNRLIVACGFAMAIAGAGLLRSAAGSIIFWDGNGGAVNWSTLNNWGTSGAGTATNPGAIPTTTDDVVFYSAGGLQLTTNIVNQAFTLQSLTFGNSQTGAVSVGGSSILTLNGKANYDPSVLSSGSSANLGTVGLYVQSGTGAVTINAPVTLGGSQQWINNSSNTLTVSAVTTGANTLTVGGSGKTTITGVVGSGSGGVTANSSGTLTLAGVSTYGGATTVAAGALVAGADALDNLPAVAGGFGNGSSQNKFTLSSGTTAGMVVGASITGTNIPNGTTITAIAGNVITMSQSVSTNNLTASNVVVGQLGAFGDSQSGGAIVLGTGSTLVGSAPSLLIGGAFTVGRSITVGSIADAGVAYNATIGGSNTTGTATYTGNITLNTTANSYTFTLQAATGGTVEFKTGSWTTNNKAIAIGTSGKTGTVKLSNALSTTGGIKVNFGTFQLGASSLLSSSTPVTVSGGVFDTTASNFNNTVSSFNMSSGSLNGGGTITAATYGLTGGTINANLGAGAVTVSTGTTTLAGAMSGSTININSGKLVVNGSTSAGSAVTVASTATLAGTGTISGSTSVQSGAAITAGAGLAATDATGKLTLAGVTLAGGGTYDWKVKSVTGAAGTSTGWDVLQISSLIVGASSAFNVTVVPASGNGFNSSTSYKWIVADITGGNSAITAGGHANPTLAQLQAAFVLDASALGSIPAGSTFTVGVQPDTLFGGGEDIVISYTATPEPNSLVLLGLAAGGAALRPRRRKFLHGPK